MAIISVQHLSKIYTYHKKEPGVFSSLVHLFYRKAMHNHAVKDVTFSIEEGEFVGFLGPNGAGKTTVLKMLSGILYPSDGKISVLQYIPQHRDRAFQKKISLVMGQKNQLWWDLPVMDSFLLHQAIYELSDNDFQTTLQELTQLLRVEHLLHIPVRKLSLGERMKCELIAALLHDPKVLFLDEPTIGLDVVSQHAIREFLRVYNKKKKTTILLTSHYMDDIESLCKRVIIINAGSLVYDGGFSSLLSNYAPYKELHVTFSQKISKKELAELGKIQSFTGVNVVLQIKKELVPDIISRLFSLYSIEDISIKEAKIDEIVRTIFDQRTSV